MAAVVCALVPLAGAQAAGAAGWALQHVPDPRGSINAVFNGVSCPSRTQCAAVGAYLSSDSSSHTLGERWDGRRWSPQSVPDPARARHIQLFGVSCSSSSACAAVGSYENRSGTTVTLAERWDGRRWSLQTVPDPRGARDSDLFGVSCAASSACVAVGSYTTGAGSTVTLAERWDGRRWSLQRVPDPSGARRARFRGVSCPSTSSCTAVGSYTTHSGSTVTLAERLTGSRWSIQSVPDPAGASNVELGAVSCSSTALCTTVGDYGNRSGKSVTLAERWDGRRWSIQSVPDPSSSVNATLVGVSCPSSSSCTAVGSYLTRTQNDCDARRALGRQTLVAAERPRPPWHPARELRRSLVFVERRLHGGRVLPG